MRYALIAMVLIGLFGIARVMFSSAGDPDEWKRWAGSVKLATLEDGSQVITTWNNEPVAVRALTPPELETVQMIPPEDLSHPEPALDRIHRVEVDGRTRWIVAAVIKGRFCRLSKIEEGWVDPCHSGHWDLTGRTTRTRQPNLTLPPVLIEGGKLYLRPAERSSANP